MSLKKLYTFAPDVSGLKEWFFKIHKVNLSFYSYTYNFLILLNLTNIFE